MTESKQAFFAKDFIETAEGLIFAVVAHGTEQGRVLCFLRYIYDGKAWQKQSTESANAFLKQRHPGYLHYSSVLDAHLHAVAISKITKHHQPKQRLQQLLTAQQDAVEQDLLSLCGLLQQHGLDLNQIGITGSLLVGVQNHSSDLDLVCYGRDVFQQCRALIRKLIGLGQLRNLAEPDWLASYDRRACALSYEDYCWHEQRKYNKAMINARKFDLNFIELSKPPAPGQFQKQGAITLQCQVIDDCLGFDYPAEFKIAHSSISSVVSFTATYTGQALAGEWVEVSGVLELSDQGQQRIVVGASREAYGEYIKVLRA